MMPRQFLRRTLPLWGACKAVGSQFVKNCSGTYCVKSKYDSESDLVIVIGKGGGNGLPDIRRVYTVNNTGPLNADITCNRVIVDHATDLIGPGVIKAVQNADGDHVDSHFFTGGNHQDNNKGTGGSATARCIDFTCTCNGLPVDTECYGDKVVFSWTNLLRGYNTTREILREEVKLLIGGGTVSVDIRHTALEDIIREIYYGLQMVSGDFSEIVFPSGKDPGPYPTRVRSDCGSKTCRTIRLCGDGPDAVEIGVCETGLGSFQYNGADHSAFNMQYGKCYFNLIRDMDFPQRKGEITAMKGYYHFYSTNEYFKKEF